MNGSNNRENTILVVDDDERAQKLLHLILEEAGYDVVAAANGREALEKMSQIDVSLVLLDIMMPELNGFQTLDLIRQQYEAPVIMLTSKREVTTLRDTLDLGADDFVRKPFNIRELLARIQAKLRRVD